MLIENFHHFLHIGFLHCQASDFPSVNSAGEEVSQAAQHHILNHLEVLLSGQLHSENDVQVPVAQAVILHQDVAGGRTIEPYVFHLDVSLDQPILHHPDNVFRSHLQGGEISSSVDGDDLGQDLVQSLDLLKGQVVEPLLYLKLHHPYLWKRGQTYLSHYS